MAHSDKQPYTLGAFKRFVTAIEHEIVCSEEYPIGFKPDWIENPNCTPLYLAYAKLISKYLGWDRRVGSSILYLGDCLSCGRTTTKLTPPNYLTELIKFLTDLLDDTSFTLPQKITEWHLYGFLLVYPWFVTLPFTSVGGWFKHLFQGGWFKHLFQAYGDEISMRQNEVSNVNADVKLHFAHTKLDEKYPYILLSLGVFGVFPAVPMPMLTQLNWKINSYLFEFAWEIPTHILFNVVHTYEDNITQEQDNYIMYRGFVKVADIDKLDLDSIFANQKNTIVRNLVAILQTQGGKSELTIKRPAISNIYKQHTSQFKTPPKPLYY